ncbi:MAG: hypothetical protein KAJ51_16490, partial [Thermoplasmata archaeon]|nr:hypothetical protein [Thermoplasmata archaeon]
AEENLTIELEYKVPNEVAWNTTDLGNPEYLHNIWKQNITIPFEVPFGFYDFRTRFNDSDGNYSTWFYLNDSLLVYNTCPKVIDIELSKSSIYRTESIFIYVNSTDHETPEANLNSNLQYKPENDNEWSDLILKYSDINNRWKTKFITTENSILGGYDLRVQFKDTEEASCEWAYLNDSLMVLNNIPNVIDLKISESEVLRNNSITIYTNGSDIEDLENELTCEIQYKLPTGAWMVLDNIVFYDDYWQVEFAPPLEAALGSYDLRVNFTDSDNDFSGWTTIEDAFEVKNNFPRITEDLDDIEIGFYAESFDLTMYGLDVEDEVEVLSWSIDQSTVDTTLFQAIIIIAPGNILHIIPWDNVTGEDDITLSLKDKDGGAVTKSDITIFVDSILTLATPKVTLLSPLDKSIVNTLTPT